MRRRLLVALVVVVTVSASACGSSADTPASDSPADAPIATPSIDGDAGGDDDDGDGVGSIGDAVAVAAAAPGQADGAACDLERRALETAVDYYLTLNGSLPTSQDDLVSQQVITERSPRFEITADGAVVPAPASPCT